MASPCQLDRFDGLGVAEGSLVGFSGVFEDVVDSEPRIIVGEPFMLSLGRFENYFFFLLFVVG